MDAAHLAQVHREFIEEDQGRFATEQLAQRVGTGRDALLIAGADAGVAFGACELECNLAPRRVGKDAFGTVPHRATVGRVRVLPIESRHADGALWKKRHVDEFRGVRHLCHATRRMRQGNQAMRLAAAVGRVQPKDRGSRTASATQSARDVGKEIPQPLRRMRIGKETSRIGILRAGLAGNDLRQVRRKVGFDDGSIEHIGAWLADFVDIRNGLGTR